MSPSSQKAGSVVDALLVGESGEAAVITYNGDVKVAKPFGAGDVQTTLKKITAGGREARSIDAGIYAIAELAKRPRSRARVLLFIGQPMDSGSEAKLTSLKEQAERENVTVFALTLPEVGKAFVSDTFSLQGVTSSAKGGFEGGVDLGKLIAVLNRSNDVEKGADPFSVLTAAMGGTQFHFRKQRQLEDGIATIGVELRSAYLLNYYPASTQTGYHSVRVEVDIPGARVYSRPGYWWAVD